MIEKPKLNLLPNSLFTKELLDPTNTPKRPISALLNLKIFNPNVVDSSHNIANQKKLKNDLSLQTLQRQINNFNKIFILPELEAKKQSQHQYIEDFNNFYETVNNEKNEEFLPVYIINPQNSEIIKKFICLNRKTRTKARSLLKSNRPQTDITAKSLKPKQIKKLNIKKIKNEEKENKLDKSELELIDLLIKKEINMNKESLNQIFALTEKTRKKQPEKNFNTVNINNLHEENIKNQIEKSKKMNFAKNHAIKINQSFHQMSEKTNFQMKSQKEILINDKCSSKNFNFSKPATKMIRANHTFRSKTKIVKKLNLKYPISLLQKNPSEMEIKEITKRTETLQGWNEEKGNTDEEIF